MTHIFFLNCCARGKLYSGQFPALVKEKLGLATVAVKHMQVGSIQICENHGWAILLLQNAASRTP
jgi:hypothetical protein